MSGCRTASIWPRRSGSPWPTPSRRNWVLPGSPARSRFTTARTVHGTCMRPGAGSTLPPCARSIRAVYLRKLKQVARALEREFGLQPTPNERAPERKTKAPTRPDRDCLVSRLSHVPRAVCRVRRPVRLKRLFQHVQSLGSFCRCRGKAEIARHSDFPALYQ
jgi:hypothetical protein